MPLGDHPRAGPLWTQQDNCDAQLADTHRSESELNRPTDAMPTSSSIKICWRTTGSAHATSPGDPDVHGPARDSRTTVSPGQGPELDAHARLSEKSCKTWGYQDQAGRMACGECEFAPLPGAFSRVQRRSHLSRMRASARRARQRCFPAAVNLLPRPFRITSLLPDRRLQGPKVHRCRWLTDRTPLGGGRDRAGPVNLEQNPQPEGMDILPLRAV